MLDQGKGGGRTYGNGGGAKIGGGRGGNGGCAQLRHVGLMGWVWNLMGAEVAAVW